MTTRLMVTGKVIEVSLSGFRVDGPGVLIQVYAPKAIEPNNVSQLLGKNVTIDIMAYTETLTGQCASGGLK